jgi:division protein CdvB (Snf7/Vps24/ESCRT-III family)
MLGLEKLFEGCSGRTIGDSGYVSKEKAERMKRHHLKFIARAQKNTKRQNAQKERSLLKKRFRIEHFNQRLKSLVGEDFSRFRTWAAAKAVIATAMVAINLGF